MWLLKVALVAFIVVGLLVILLTYIRRSRTVRFRQEADPNLGSLSQMGVVPPTPLPEWVNWPDADEPEDPRPNP